jgi:hypothetical protein
MNLIGYFSFSVLRKDLTLLPRMILNLRSSCLHFLSAGITWMKWIDSFQIKQKWPINTWKKFSILIYQRNANSNFLECQCPLSQNNYHHENKTQQRVVKVQWSKECIIPCWWKCKLVQPLWKSMWKFLKKCKIQLQYDSATPVPDMYSKEWKQT